MATTPFLQRLAQNKPILADGAMGTELHAHGASTDSCFDELNLNKPEVVFDIHRAYVEAGAELLETNTFSANRFKLAEYGLGDQLEAINRAGVELAKRAASATGRDVYVAGALGPLGGGLQPYGRIKPDDARAAFTEQIKVLADAGADLILMETFTDLGETREAVKAAKAAAPDLPVIAQMTFGQDDRTLLGNLPGDVARTLYDEGADVIGVNCSGGPEQISRVLQAMRQAVPEARCSAMPN